MCFSIPYKVLKVKNGKAIIEGGKRVIIGEELKVKKGDYLRVVGNIAVGAIPISQALKIRRLIKQLN